MVMKERLRLFLLLHLLHYWGVENNTVWKISSIPNNFDIWLSYYEQWKSSQYSPNEQICQSWNGLLNVTQYFSLGRSKCFEEYHLWFGISYSDGSCYIIYQFPHFWETNILQCFMNFRAFSIVTPGFFIFKFPSLLRSLKTFWDFFHFFFTVPSVTTTTSAATTTTTITTSATTTTANSTATTLAVINISALVYSGRITRLFFRSSVWY